MQSEFACHVGPGGKMLCRICNVKGMDVATSGSQSSAAPTSSANEGHTTPDSMHTSDLDGSDNGNSSASDTGVTVPASGRKRKLEGMQDMTDRVTRFIQTGPPRTRDNTLQELHNIIADAGSIGNISKIRAHKTSTGIKDTFLEAYLKLMHQSYKSKSTRHDKQTALDNFRETLPANIRMLSPVWQIRGRFTFTLLHVTCV